MLQHLTQKLLAAPLSLLALALAAGCSVQPPSADQAPDRFSIKQVKCAYYLKGEERTEDVIFDKKKGQIFEYDEFTEALSPVNMSTRRRFKKLVDGWDQEITKSYKMVITDSGKIKYSSEERTFFEKFDKEAVAREENILDLNTMKLEGRLTTYAPEIEGSERSIKISGNCKYVKPDSTKVIQDWKDLSGF